MFEYDLLLPKKKKRELLIESQKIPGRKEFLKYLQTVFKVFIINSNFFFAWKTLSPVFFLPFFKAITFFLIIIEHLLLLNKYGNLYHRIWSGIIKDFHIKMKKEWWQNVISTEVMNIFSFFVLVFYENEIVTIEP